MLKKLLLTRGAEVFVFTLLLIIPLTVDNAYTLGLLTLLAIYGILLIGLDVTVGYLGQVNLAQSAFLGIGAYTTGLLLASPEMGIIPALIASLIVGGIFGGLLAFPALRLSGPQFALATLSFGALTTTVLNELESLTGGAQGLSIMRPQFLGLDLDAQHFYWVCLVIFAMVWLGMKNVLSSQWGRAFEALRDSPIATDAMGIGTYRHKIIAFALGSALGGLAGGLYALNFQYLQPQSFVYEMMVILLLGVVLGGRKNLWGAFVGATIIALLPNLLSNRLLFEVISGLGFIIALIAGFKAYRSKTTPIFQALAPAVAMGMLVIGSLFTENIEDWRKAIFALILFSVVVGLPNGLMGFVIGYLHKVFKVEANRLENPADLSTVLNTHNNNQTDKPLLTVEALKRHFGGVKAVDDVSFNISHGEVHGLIGPNGSGKSTVVNVLSGLYAPTSGTIKLSNRVLPYGSLYQTAKHGISRTFQNLQIFGELTALDNIMVSLNDVYKQPLIMITLGLFHAEEKNAESQALALLDLVGLKDQARVLAKDLPYGAQRFLEIARALACKPQLLILDEPAAGLAHPDVMRLKAIIQKIRQFKIAIILIEHHMDVVTELCDKVTVLDGGKIIATGYPDDVKRNPKVIEAYLGDTDLVDQH